MEQIKVFFITGATSGLGYSVAEKALSLGHKVVGTTRTLKKFEQTDFPKKYPNTFLAVETDLLNEEILKTAIKKALDTFGRIDVLLNNSGCAYPGAVEEISNKELQMNFDANFFAPMNVLRAILPIMREQKSGQIFNISSIVGFSHFTGCSAYNASKWALIGVSNTLADEMKQIGLPIKVSAICPGTFATPILGGFPFAENLKPEVYDTKNFLNHWLDRRINKPILGDPEKYAEKVIHFTTVENVPVHIFIGPDAVDIAQQQIDLMQKELNSYKDQVIDTDLKN